MFVIRYFASLLASIDWKRWVCEEGRSTFTQKCDLIFFLFPLPVPLLRVLSKEKQHHEQPHSGDSSVGPNRSYSET